MSARGVAEKVRVRSASRKRKRKVVAAVTACFAAWALYGQERPQAPKLVSYEQPSDVLPEGSEDADITPVDVGVGLDQKQRSKNTETVETNVTDADVTSSSGTSGASRVESPLFHMVFTTGSTTLSLINLRSIESVFFSNPEARLHIHQPFNFTIINTSSKRGKNATRNSKKTTPVAGLDKSHSRLAPLIKKGYNITFHRYDPARVLRRALDWSRGEEIEINSTDAKNFIATIPKKRKQKYWYSNESNLMRLCLLYLQGGTYMDTDVIILRSFEVPIIGGSGNPSMGKERLPLDGAIFAPENNVVSFQMPRHPFIAAALNNFMANYDGLIWGNNGPRVLKRTSLEHQNLLCDGEVKKDRIKVWETRTKGKKSSKKTKRRKQQPKRCATLLDKNVIQPVWWDKWYDFCGKSNSPTGSKAKSLLKKAYAAHLNNKLTGEIFERGGSAIVNGSVCELLMNGFCKVCPK